MKLGVLTVPLQGMTARDAFAYLHSLESRPWSSAPAVTPITTI